MSIDKCRACAHSGCEPSDDPYCGHNKVIKAGHPFGLYLRNATKLNSICGENRELFEQHPSRNIWKEPNHEKI